MKQRIKIKIFVSQLGVPAKEAVCSPDWTIEQLSETLYSQAKAEGKFVRFIYSGRVVENGQKLGELGIVDGNTIHVHLSDIKPNEPGSTATNGNENHESEDEEMELWRLQQQFEAEGQQYRSVEETGAREGSNRHFMIGLLLGLLFREIALFWVCYSSLPRKQKVGIIVGVCLGILQDILWGKTTTFTHLGDDLTNGSGPVHNETDTYS